MDFSFFLVIPPVLFAFLQHECSTYAKEIKSFKYRWNKFGEDLNKSGEDLKKKMQVIANEKSAIKENNKPLPNVLILLEIQEARYEEAKEAIESALRYMDVDTLPEVDVNDKKVKKLASIGTWWTVPVAIYLLLSVVFTFLSVLVYYVRIFDIQEKLPWVDSPWVDPVIIVYLTGLLLFLIVLGISTFYKILVISKHKKKIRKASSDIERFEKESRVKEFTRVKEFK